MSLTHHSLFMIDLCTGGPLFHTCTFVPQHITGVSMRGLILFMSMESKTCPQLLLNSMHILMMFTTSLDFDEYC